MMGASVMAGHKGGVQAIIRKQCTSAVYVHCASHSLNLVLASASSVIEIRNMFSKLAEVINFVNDSPKRGAKFNVNLIKYCSTRFIQRHDSILRFVDNYTSVLDGLCAIIEDSCFDAKTRGQATSFLDSITDSTFLIAMSAANKVLSLTLPLSKLLQKVSLTYGDMKESVDEVLETLKSWRGNEKYWNGSRYSAFQQAQKCAELAETELTKPRCPSRQTHRSSFKDCGTSDYFKRSIWFPFLDNVISNLADKFSDDAQPAFLLFDLLLQSTAEVDVMKFQEVFRIYGAKLDVVEQRLYEEVELFLKYKSQAYSEINSAADMLKITPMRFENIRELLKIAITLPITSCEAERAFSAMKILKSRNRTTMADMRLNGLALMYIHKNIGINCEEVINNLALKGRRLNFVL